MKIVIYSSNSNQFDGENIHYYNYPTIASFWEKFTNHHFVFISQLPASFLFDLENNQISSKASNVEYVIKKAEPELILSYNPDLVISASFWVNPFDWLSIHDAMIGEKLKELRPDLKIYCHPLKSCQLAFDKNQTRIFFENNNFNHAKGLYVHHQLYWAQRNHQEIEENFYKEALIYQIQKLKLPLIIKDTCGLSSYGMEVCKTYKEVIGFLNSKKNKGDKIVEEFIPGLQFGTEIHGNKIEGYKIFDPFMFSVNQYGITSPKQSIKVGPVNNSKYKIDDLKNELLRMAHLLDFNGIAQVDLVFNQEEEKWYFIEINPRLSGMTQIIMESKDNKKYMAIKLPVLKKEEIEEIKKFEFIVHLSQIENKAAKQKREEGYCEIIFGRVDSKEELENQLDLLKEKIPHLIDEGFYCQAKKMLLLI
ncbi:MAG: ATP-grasp domain-containing protein [Treponema sp.]|nr:ATP-grasp domain-containing protein [Treponema sp.]